jgi:hypothetical protein
MISFRSLLKNAKW